MKSYRKTWKRILLLFLLCGISLGVCGCKKEEIGTAYSVYYVNPEETAIFPKEYRTQTTDKETLLTELLSQLETIPEKLEYKTPLGGSVDLVNYSISEDQLILDFDENYRSQQVITEVLVRAAIVRTLTQIDGIRYVSFQIKGEPLTDASGTVLGVMTADMFIDNAGNEINNYEKAKLLLYLADEEGTGLKTVTRTVIYNSNIPMERLVVEQLIAGAKENEGVYPTVNPNTKIVSVNVKDGICYVDLDNTFLTQINNVTAEVTIYSIANSLIELPNVNKVQISVSGDTSVNYREGVSLTTVFERNLELVE